MAYRLRDNLHYCVVGGRTIFLDIDADRYFGLPTRVDAAFQRIAHGGATEADDRESLQPLLARGLLVPDPDSSGLRAPISIIPPVREITRERTPNAKFVVSARAAIAQLSAMALLRMKSLADIKRAVEARRRGIVDHGDFGSTSEFGEIAAGFEALNLLFRTADRCLVRSLAFLSICHNRRLVPSLVFGVQTSPFSAHCWIQQDDIVLNDAAENVRPYSPIMLM